jgi:hypothetical protein
MVERQPIRKGNLIARINVDAMKPEPHSKSSTCQKKIPCSHKDGIYAEPFARRLLVNLDALADNSRDFHML